MNKFLSVSYELYVEAEGSAPVLVEKTSRDHSFQFITGLGFALPDFEAHLENLNVGDKFDFTITSDKAYGPYDENHVKELPKDIFRNSGGHFDAETIYPGNVIPMQNEDGLRFDGLVKEVKQDVVVIDFNHELAGMDLHFIGEVLAAEEASAQQISQFINSTCSCGGDCGGSCDHNHEGGCCSEKKGHDHCGCGHCH